MYFWILFFVYCALILFLFDITPVNYQWAIALLLVFVRETGECFNPRPSLISRVQICISY